MRLPGKGWFWATSAILSVAVVCLSPSQVRADWTYGYQENFSTEKAQTDCYYHSIFWPQGAYPPSEPYLYYLGTGSQRELGFGDHHGELASISYRFPINPPEPTRMVSGSLRVKVSSPNSTGISGNLLYTSSSDGITWSSPQQLSSGTHDIWIESVRGTYYITFLGTDVLIDDLEVDLSDYPATIRVPQDYSTIQRAVDVARYGDVVEVAPGTYGGEGNWDIDFRGRSITVRSTAGPERTIIDCRGSGHRGFYFHAGEGPDSVLRGFTITDGIVSGSEIPSDNASWNSSPTHPVGGGIYCEFSSPSIVDCIIKRCTAEVGGGIGCVSSSPTIIDCVIEQCSAGGQGPAESGGYGAGIGLIRDSEVEIIDCRIEDNMGYYNSLGGGVYCWQSEVFLAGCTLSSNSASGNIIGGGLYGGGSSSEIILKNCIISKNTAEVGGGIYIGSNPGSSSDSIRESVSIVDCTIADNNLSGSYSASSTGGGIHSVNSNIAVSNSIVWDNDGKAIMLISPSSSSPVLYSDVEGGYSGQGNIDADPLFASAGGNDYHLQSALEEGRYDPWSGRWIKDNNHSPCIDTGDPQDPVNAEPLPNGKRINMGAYGGTNQASKGEGAWIYHVDGSSGRDSNGGMSRSDAFATIQKAVDVAYPGDIIMVWPGTYREEIWFQSKAITLQSADHAAVITADNYALNFFGAESSSCVVRNFVITGCGDAGIYCNSASPTLTNLTITNNLLGVRSEGGANPDIVNCILWNNLNGDLYHCRASYSCVAQADALTPDSGNFNDDPLFADPASGDYHLMSKHGRYSPATKTWVYDSVTSPCIDKGSPNMDPGREQMPNGGRINVGAYGGTPFASLSRNSW